MIRIVTLRHLGEATRAMTPEAVLGRQRFGADDYVFAIETSQGIFLTAVDSATTGALAAYAELAAENRDAMAALAKR